jgi:parallel beta-helix repeat protein
VIKQRLVVFFGTAALACSSSPACPTGAPGCVSIGSGTSAAEIEKDFATLQDGATVVFGPGTFMMTDTITIAANNVTVLGAGSAATIFDFSGEKGGDGEGFFAQSVHDIRLEGFTVRDTLGNGVKVLGSTGVILRDVTTTWTSTDATTHGGYGLYPVQCTNVLVEKCEAIGASDAGIYLGQSDHAVLRNNKAHDNVAGIEVENTFFADVYGNDAHDNTAGVLVFALPGLQQEGGHDVHVHDNQIHDNNTSNFGAAGSTVGIVPRGTGFLVMANANVEFDHNDVENNLTGNTAVLSYYVTQIAIQDQAYYPLPAKVFIHDNTFVGGGTTPDLTKQIGLLLASAEPSFPNNAVPSLVWDGIVDATIATTTPVNPMQICYMNNGAATFVDLHLDLLDPKNPNLPAILTQDMTDYVCTLPSLPAVTFPGLAP